MERISHTPPHRGQWVLNSTDISMSRDSINGLLGMLSVALPCFVHSLFCVWALIVLAAKPSWLEDDLCQWPQAIQSGEATMNFDFALSLTQITFHLSSESNEDSALPARRMRALRVVKSPSSIKASPRPASISISAVRNAAFSSFNSAIIEVEHDEHKLPDNIGAAHLIQLISSPQSSQPMKQVLLSLSLLDEAP